MIDPRKQPIRISIEVTYDAPVYDGDPKDAFEIANLEKAELEETIHSYLGAVIGELKHFKLTAQPE